MKTVLFVPGFPEDFESRDYASVLKTIESKGYKTVFVPIQWKRKTITDWVAEFEAVYAKHEPKDTILAGFSYGAMTVLVAARKRLPAALWLFSLSPYFSEDMPYLKHTWLREIGKQRTEKFWQLSFDKLGPNIICPVQLFIGEKEMKKYPQIGRRFKDASKKFKYCRAIEVPGAAHAVEHKNYIKAIKANI